jgi:hypothetical protein
VSITIQDVVGVSYGGVYHLDRIDMLSYAKLGWYGLLFVCHFLDYIQLLKFLLVAGVVMGL